MNSKSIVILMLAAGIAATPGCTEAEPASSEALERATRSESVLTSTRVEPTPVPLDKEEETSPSLDEVEELDEVEAAPEPRSFEPLIESRGGVAIQRLLTSSAIENREPVRATSRFEHHDEKVYAFVELSNEGESDETVRVHFIGPDGSVTGGIELRIPALTPRWRTWAYTRNAKEPGLWRVEIRSEDGSLLGALPFEVEPGC